MAAGSDGGHVFVFDAASGQCLRCALAPAVDGVWIWVWVWRRRRRRQIAVRGRLRASRAHGLTSMLRCAVAGGRRVMASDEDVANAVQCHPHLPVLAVSGIENTIKLWSPEGECMPVGSRIDEIISNNQERNKEGTRDDRL